MKSEKIIVVSGVSLRSGGTLTILNECLSYLNNFARSNIEYKIIAFVHDKNAFSYENIELIEIKKAKESWLYRLYVEYFYFKKYSKKIKPYLWLSLQDISPNVKAEKKAVYCQNPTPFYKTKIKDLFYRYEIFLFSIFYKYLYKINIRKNNYVIVQQNWLKNSFAEMFKLDKKKIIVAYPNEKKVIQLHTSIKKENSTLFFYPSIPRVFKNFEVIYESVKILNKKGIEGFKVILTFDGTEDNYAKSLFKKYSHIENIQHTGLMPHEKVMELYNKVDCLLFPSKLETWGLPISEFIPQNKPMLIADLPYAYETASGAQYVDFFNPENAEELASKMEKVMKKDFSDFHPCKLQKIDEPFTQSWKELFDIILQ